MKRGGIASLLLPQVIGSEALTAHYLDFVNTESAPCL
jgi:hypothetical protein